MTARAKFTKADLKRAASGVVAAGLPIRKIEIDQNGKITILTGHPTNQADEDNSEWADLA